MLKVDGTTSVGIYQKFYALGPCIWIVPPGIKIFAVPNVIVSIPRNHKISTGIHGHSSQVNIIYCRCTDPEFII